MGDLKDGLSTNPKDALGRLKYSPSTVPAAAIAIESEAMQDGARKYGAYNWRDKKVSARVYIDACKRHLDSWLEGEENAPDSGFHHLGHARACLGILLDAQVTGNLIDDRPPGGANVVECLRRINARKTS